MTFPDFPSGNQFHRWLTSLTLRICGFRFVIGIPPVIIHGLRWDFPWCENVAFSVLNGILHDELETPSHVNHQTIAAWFSSKPGDKTLHKPTQFSSTWLFWLWKSTIVFTYFSSNILRCLGWFPKNLRGIGSENVPMDHRPLRRVHVVPNFRVDRATPKIWRVVKPRLIINRCQLDLTILEHLGNQYLKCAVLRYHSNGLSSFSL